MSTKQEEELREVMARHRLNYASLFGSLELCDCSDCRSIHSPAAYLVDVLQFLGPKTSAVTPLDVLIGNPDKKVTGRRPDIAHIKLSCANTNTTLPYVDLVNEALESYIVFNQTLPMKTDVVPPVPQPNESSLGVTGGELAGAPEHTSDLAYVALEEAVYPCPLPFDQPLTSLRLTLEEMGSSRHEVMSVFRRDDTDPGGTAIDVEALKITQNEFKILTGKLFDGTPSVRAVSDFFGFETPAAPVDTPWVAGTMPAGAVPQVAGDAWAFAAFAPPPASGALTHDSAVANGLHQHYFDKATATLRVESEDVLYAEIFIDPARVPQQVMLQWNDGTWEHRAYWGASAIGVGVEGTASLRYMGALPAVGSWVRLEVPAYYVGLAGRDVAGLAFTLFDGHVTWGAAGKRSPSWVESVAHVPTLLARTAITYVDLIALLRTRYLNPALPEGETLALFDRIPISYRVLSALVATGFAAPDGQTLKALDDAALKPEDLETWATAHFAALSKLIVLDAPDSACDLTLTRLQHLDGSALDDDEWSRLHRMIRLWRKTGWTIPDLNRAFVALQATDITAAFLRQLGHVVQLRDVLKLPLQKLFVLWGSVSVTGDDALYRSLFKHALQHETVFAAVNGEYLAASRGLKIDESVAELLAAFRVRAVDLTQIRADAGLSAAAAPLTLSTVSTLYRYVVLSRALKMAVADLIDLQTLWGETPFSVPDPITTFKEIDPARTLRFVRLAGNVKRSGFPLTSLKYVFSSVKDAPPDKAPTDAAIELLLAKIREGLARIAAENEPADDPTGEVTRGRLGVLFDAGALDQIAGLVSGTQVYAAPLTALPTGITVPPGNVRYEDGLLKVLGWLADADRVALLALSIDASYQTAVNSLSEQQRGMINQTLVAQLRWTKAEADLQASVLEPSSFASDGSVDAGLVAGKYKAFLTALLPHLRTRLSRGFVKQVLAEALGLEPTSAALLLEGKDGTVLLGTDADRTRPVIDDFLALSGDGLTATTFANETLTAPPTGTHVDPAMAFPWDPHVGFSSRWEGQLLADKTQRYQLHVRVGGGVRLSVDGRLLIDQWSDAAPREYTAGVDLEAGTLYAIQLDYFNHASAAADEPDALLALRWSGPATPGEIVPTSRLYSKTRGDVRKAARDSYIRLHKASLLVNGGKLNSDEIGYLANPATVQSLNLSDLPVLTAPADTPALFSAWTRWNDFADLRAQASDAPALLDVYAASAAAAAQSALVRAFGWNADSLVGLVGVDGFQLKNADYQDAGQLQKLVEATRLLGLFGAVPKNVFDWAITTPDNKQCRFAAETARRAHRAQYDNEAWLDVARSVTDKLRESQRAALVAYHLTRLGLADTGELFGYFLIDVEMSPCMLTSRIKQAISSVQLFVQRCRMNQEPQVDPKMINESLWQWMQNYRVWEANLRVFLYPENWIEPELRDDKSPFFRELESGLLQEEVTAETAEVALGNYLEKLDRVSQLKICGMYEQLDFAGDEKRERVLHVFGRTFTSPATFYYRQLVTVNPNYRYWTAWEAVALDIEADEVLPVIWNRRLYLFWEVTTPKPVPGTGETEIQIRIAWSEYRNRKWSAKQITPADQTLTPSLPGSHRMDVQISGDELTIVFATASEPICLTAAYSIEGEPTGPKTKAASYRHGSLTFRNYNGLAVPNVGSTKPIFYSDGFTEFSSTSLEFTPVNCADESVAVFGRIPDIGRLDLFAPGSRPYTLNDPFFLQQGPRAYLVVPQSPVAPSLLYEKADDGAAFYLPSGKGAAAAFAETKDLGLKFVNSVEMIRADPNPWSAGRATTAAKDVTSALISKPDSDGSISITKESGLFGYALNKVAALVPVLATFRFETFFHPYAPEFQRRLHRYGVAGLLNLDSQLPARLPPVTSFAAAYAPERSVKSLPVHDVDFTFPGSYSLYNWEIFFHIPLLVATRLSQNQRFEEAMRWFHYIFDPTAWSSGDSAPERYWKVRPLREAQAQRLDDMLKAFHAGDRDMVAQWEDLQANPFQPHRVARMRPAAYQKTVVMKYFDNAIAWADQLYRRDTIESINQATHLYVMVAILLGPQAQRVPPRGRTANRTFAELRSGLDDLNQTMVQFENDLPFTSRATSGGSGAETAGLMGIGRSFYFCLPKNDKLSSYWETIADRLFKIRNCMNIDGVVRELALFEPRIDPALLVRAAASGVDLGTVLSDLSAPLPYYRFTTLLAKALELAGELRSLGADLLATVEKRDAERLANLRLRHETELLLLVKQVKRQQLTEAQTTAAALEKTRDVTQVRLDFYTNIAQRIGEETNQMNELAAALSLQEEGQSAEGIAADISTFVPDISVGMASAVTAGRGNIVAAFQGRSREKNFEASVHSYNANRSSLEGGWKRRADDWKLQKDLAAKELLQIEKQIAAAAIRVAIAQQELDNTSRQIEQSREVDEFLRTKFTNEELYSWRVGGISTLFFQCYQMTYDVAKQAERSYRFDLGLTTSSFITFGTWDSQRKGLLSGERLYLQLKQMERAYMNANRRGYELTKHYSLVQNDPQALITLKATGQCEIELPEALFDADYPGHYMRRIKTVSLTIPAVVGPYSSVNCTLTLLRDKTRVKSSVADDYPERESEEDDRFVTNWARTQAIVTSGGQNDSGMFELNFHDERYLPFEGAGAAGSRWRIELDRDCNAFDVMTLPDVILHLRYAAWDGGGRLKSAAKAALENAIGAEASKPQARMFSLRHEFPTEWSLFTGATAATTGSVAISRDRFPFLFKGKTLTASKVRIYAVLKNGPPSPAPLAVRVTPPAGTEVRVEFAAKSKWRGILAPKSTLELATEIKTAKADTTWGLKTDSGDLAKHVDDLLLVCEYNVE